MLGGGLGHHKGQLVERGRLDAGGFPGGDFDTSRPPEIDNVGLLVTTVVQPFEISRSIYTNDAYASIVQKELTSSYFTGLYYNKTLFRKAGLTGPDRKSVV